jgi:hypothetical protein
VPSGDYRDMSSAMVEIFTQRHGGSRSEPLHDATEWSPEEALQSAKTSQHRRHHQPRLSVLCVSVVNFAFLHPA